MTKKQIDETRRKARVELFGTILAIDYAIDDLIIVRDDLRSSSKFVTKDINKQKRILSNLIKKYEEIADMKYNPRKRK